LNRVAESGSQGIRTQAHLFFHQTRNICSGVLAWLVHLFFAFFFLSCFL